MMIYIFAFHLCMFLTFRLSYAGGQKKTILALGDSVAAGQLPGYIFRSGEGFNDVLFEYLETNYGFDTLADGACAGETTQNFLNATQGLETCDFTDFIPSRCYASFCNDEDFFPPIPGASMMDAAEQYLMNHPGEVGLITLNIGSNDLSACLVGKELAEISTCLLSAMQQLAENLVQILGRLQQYGIPIVGSNIYNPVIAYTTSDDISLKTLGFLSGDIIAQANAIIEETFGMFNILVVDTYTAVHGTTDALVSLCEHSAMCSKKEDGSYELREDLIFSDHIHLNELGYSLVGQAFIDIVDQNDILISETNAPVNQDPITEAPISSEPVQPPTVAPVMPTVPPVIPVISPVSPSADAPVATMPPERPSKKSGKKLSKKKSSKKKSYFP